MTKNNNIKYTGVQSKSTNVYNFEYPGEKCYCVQTVGTNRVIDTRSLKNTKNTILIMYMCVLRIFFFKNIQLYVRYARKFHPLVVLRYTSSSGVHSSGGL